MSHRGTKGIVSGRPTGTSFVAHDWEVAKEPYILCKRALHSLQKSPIFSGKEPCEFPVTREWLGLALSLKIERWQKSPTFSAKEPYIPCKRALHSLQKSPTFSGKEPNEFPVTLERLGLALSLMIERWQKSPAFSAKEPTFSGKEPYEFPVTLERLGLALSLTTEM